MEREGGNANDDKCQQIPGDPGKASREFVIHDECVLVTDFIIIAHPDAGHGVVIGLPARAELPLTWPHPMTELLFSWGGCHGQRDNKRRREGRAIAAPEAASR